MTAKKQRGNNDGAVLLTVLTVACFAAILLTAVLSFVGRAHTNAYNNYNSEQAYYIASSALGSIHDYFEEADGSYTKLLEMANANSNAGTTGTLKFSDGSDTIEMSELVKDSNCTVKVSRMGDGYIKLSVTGYCRGQAETINAYYTVEESQAPGGIDNALYCDGLATFEQKVSSSGPLTTRKSYNTGNGSAGNGTIITGQDFYAEADGYYWKPESRDNAKSYIIVGHNFKIKNSAVFEPQTVKVNDNTDQFIAIGGQFYPYAKTTIGGDGGRDMDVYCSNAFMANNQAFNLYGNLYCYKLTEDEFNRVHAHTHSTEEELNNILQIETGFVDYGSYKAPGTKELTLDDNGDMHIANENSTKINGNVYVEGDVVLDATINQDFIITKELYLGTESKFIYDDTKDYNKGISVTKLHAPGLTDADVVKLIKAKVLSFPITETRQEWLDELNKANAIDLHGLLAPYFDNNSFSHDVPTTREYMPDTNFDTYQRDYEITEEYLKKHAEIKAAYDGATDDITKFYVGVGAADGQTSLAMHDNDIGLDIDYLINDPGSTGCVISYLNGSESVQGNGNKNGGVVLVDLNAIGHDYVIKLKPQAGGNQVNLNGTDIHPAAIIVKNGTRDLTTGEWIEEPKHNLYIITDDGAPGATVTVNTDRFGVYDYYTYYYAIKHQYAINLMSYIDENGKQANAIFVNESVSNYMDPNNVIHGIYTPSLTRYYFMLNPGDTFTVNVADYYFLECVLYAPKATISCKGVYGYTNAWFMKYSDNSKKLRSLCEGFESPNKQQSSYLACLGAMICDEFTGHETFGVAFFPPCPDAGLGGSKMESETTIKFSHYESR